MRLPALITSCCRMPSKLPIARLTAVRSSFITKTAESARSHRKVAPRWLRIFWEAHPLVVVVGVTALALAVTVALIWPVTDLIAAHDVGLIAGPKRPRGPAAAREAARTQLLTLGAGAFAASALWFTARNFVLSREGQVTDRYTRAIEQLGSGKPDVRIGGIYALERVARDSAKDHATVMEVLSAFIREQARREPRPITEPSMVTVKRTTSPDVNAAVIVIGRRDRRYDRGWIHLDGVDLSGVHLNRTNLAGADLSGADLTGAWLNGADFTGAYLDAADLTDAFLYCANLTRARLARADLSNAYLSGADLSRANLADANLTAAALGGADVTALTDEFDLTYVLLAGANVDPKLEAADLPAAKFDSAELDGTLWPEDAPIPDGWVGQADSRLQRKRARPGAV
jgi:hypothetical protein